MDELKQLLKNMNLDYAVSGDSKISTTAIENKALVQHIEFCFRLAAENHICLDVIEEEWERLMESVR